MPIEIEIKTVDDRDYLIVDGHPLTVPDGVIKTNHILDYLEFLGYITIKVEEE